MCEEKGKGVKETTKEEAAGEKAEEEGTQIPKCPVSFYTFQ